MVKSTRATAGVAIVLALLSTACTLAPISPDVRLREGALQRWSLCLERFDTNLEHYCDGHRRDVLATYPRYHQYRINSLLLSKTRAVSKARSLKTALDATPAER